jgi:tetratricopeptide (TPR) repeat protein
MSKVGRNEPCPCGSGQKYKKCCESKAIDEAAARARAHAAAAAARLAEDRAPLSALKSALSEWVDDGLDELSYSVVTLIKEKRFEEALAVCERLRTEFPDVHDWLERSAMVHEARGDFALALDFYRRHVAFITDPERRDGYDEELIDVFRNKVVELEAKVPEPTFTAT